MSTAPLTTSPGYTAWPALLALFGSISSITSTPAAPLNCGSNAVSSSAVWEIIGCNAVKIRITNTALRMRLGLQSTV